MKPSKDLDEQIEDTLANAIDYYISGNGVHPEAISRIKTIIEQREREARVDELNQYRGDHGDCPTNCISVRIEALQKGKS